MKYELHIKEKARGKARPRFTMNGKHTYTPDTTKNFEHLIKLDFQKMYGKIDITENPIEVNIVVKHKIPKRISKKIRKNILYTPCTVKPDIDNIVKLIMDSLNGLVYKDDKQVFKVTAIKVYAEEDEIFIGIDEVRIND